MIYPSMDGLLKKVDCKYTLVTIAAKRAREIMNGESAMVECESNKPVTIALEEIAQDRLVYKRTKTSIK